MMGIIHLTARSDFPGMAVHPPNGPERESRRVNPLIEHHREAILALCRTYGVARLELFGSAMTSAFDPEHSDINFIVEYPPDYDFGPWLKRFQELEEALAGLLGRDVDLVMTSALRNRWFNREAAKTRTVIYDASTAALTRVDRTITQEMPLDALL